MTLQLKQAKLTYVVPFYWGYYINISHLLNEGYRTIQMKMISTLNEFTNDETWFVEDDIGDERVWNMKENNVYGGSTKLGTSFIARQIKPKKKFTFVSCNLEVTELLFFYHEFGVGTCRLTVNYESNEAMTIGKYEDTTRSRPIVTQLLNYINTFIGIDCKVITEKLVENNIPIAIDAQHFKELIASETIQVSYRKALWEHVIYEFNLDKSGSITDEDVEPYRALINSSQIKGCTNSTLDPYLRVYPGFGTSLILSTQDSDLNNTNLIRVLEIAEYYYAATSMLDDLMYDKFTTFSIKRLRTKKIATIQNDLEEIQSLSNLLEVFLFNLKDSMINFNPDAKLIWQALENEWYYSPMIESLQSKGITLTEKYRDLLNELNEKRNETLNKFVKIFTFFAVLGPAFEAYSILQEMNFFEKLFSLDPIYLMIGGGVILLVFVLFGGFAFSKLREFY